MIWLHAWLSCTPPEPLPPGTLSGRRFTSEDMALQLDFGPGWSLVTDPALFRSGLPATQLEARNGDLKVALTFTQLSGLAMQGGSAVDLLHELSPAPNGTAQDPSYRYGRLPRCGDAAFRSLQEHHWLARRTDTGLAILHAWGADPAPARVLLCGPSTGPTP
ncbi:MAG: hypothetical protein VX899_13695 [Myxococcota bacterium]|nr:hypothetical protein [Myxococcota bacterium]